MGATEERYSVARDSSPNVPSSHVFVSYIEDIHNSRLPELVDKLFSIYSYWEEISLKASTDLACSRVNGQSDAGISSSRLYRRSSIDSHRREPGLRVSRRFMTRCAVLQRGRRGSPAGGWGPALAVRAAAGPAPARSGNRGLPARRRGGPCARRWQRSPRAAHHRPDAPCRPCGCGAWTTCQKACRYAAATHRL